MDYVKELLINDYGEGLANEIIDGFVDKDTTIRCNVEKEEVINFLKEKGIPYEEVSTNNLALLLKDVDNKEIETWDLYKEGKIYLQSLSSQIPPFYMKVNNRDQVLDMCAAPGSKTTQLSHMYPNILITACERDKYRAERLKFNVQKQNCNNVTVLNQDSLSLSEYMKFDSILLDVNCSGIGTIGTDKQININEYSLNKIVENQEKLLNKAISLLKNDKYMVYSTCSILKRENEEQIKKVLSDDIEIIPISLDGVELLPSSIEGVLTVKPNKEYEGFFIALLHKK